ncbi:Ig-like domain-containing protein, partial [Listeria booriae]|uniref:Ig-like domain-containing protein n=1 Tax=Listeria booriae TaxID=1552123 RepID=UPI0021C8EB4F
MTNKKRANKIAKITVASAIALSALAQPLGTVVTVKASEAPAITKAESKLLQSTGLKASVPVTLKNAQFASTDTSIPNWELIPMTTRNLFVTPYSIGTKQSDGYFKVNGSPYNLINPDGQGSFLAKFANSNDSYLAIRQIVDTIPGVTYTFKMVCKGMTSNADGLLLQQFRIWVQGEDNSTATSPSGTLPVYQNPTNPTREFSFVADSKKTALVIHPGINNTEANIPIVQYGNFNLSASGTESIATPTINTLTDNDTVVTGTGAVGKTARIELSDGTFLTGTVGSDGKYSIEISKQAKDKVIKVMLYDGQGNVSPEASTTVVADTVAPPTINAVTSDDTTVKGTGVNGATVTLTIGGTNYTGTVSGGEYSITIPKQSAGTVISATESLNGKTSTSVNTTVTQGTVAAPTINAVTTDDTTVKGTGINGATVTVIVGDQDYTATVTGGEYSVTIPKQAYGTQITAKQTLNGKTSSSVNTTVTQGTVAAPVISPVTSDDTTVKGTGINGAIVTITIGSETYTGTVTDGKYSVTIPKQAVGTQISAKQSLNGKTSSSVNTTVTQGTVAAPVISPVTTDDTTVKGTGINGAIVTITIGSETYTGTV